VYVDCHESTALNQLQKDVAIAVREHLKLVNDRGERPFRPHMTIAFRDLKKPKFYEAREEFRKRKFVRTFPVEDIVLLKHNGRSWDIISRAELTRNE
jgi:2'-5' RNA ligase